MKPKLIVCIKQRSPTSDSCAGRGSLALVDQLQQGIQKKGLNIDLETVHCLGECHQGPNMRLAPGGEFFHGVETKDIETIIDKMADFLTKNPP
ncbi:MAG: (2Fe-2S) ferredoxin domain-containing protein [Magnetococcales bacterium]|nr:(2Fe-2S) ferredoxin domain-containing protein [Magnetococcales bacterium]